MKKTILFLTLVLVSIILAGCVPPGQSPQPPTGRATASVIATSCDGDSVCEVAKTVSTRARSSSNLILTSDTKKVDVNGDLAVKGKVTSSDLIVSGKITSTSNGEGMLDFVSFSDFYRSFRAVHFTGPGDYDPTTLGKYETANEICQGLGYRSCEAAVYRSTRSFYSSTDGTCSGIQVNSSSDFFQGCSDRSQNYSCGTNPVSSGLEEPAAGDTSFASFLVGAFCRR